jgi:TM2 domain-containing membrane protein YozV
MSPTCPYCSAQVAAEDADRFACPSCGAEHHGECWRENGGCTVFGCSAAPSEGPTVTVGATDLNALPPPAAAPLAYPPVAFYAMQQKDRTTYVLLGVFFGIFGVHNFYAGYTGRAIAQLVITLGTLFLGSFVTWIWALIEVCVVERDGRNIDMV